MAMVWNSTLDEKLAECSCAPCRSFWKKAFQAGAENIIKDHNERAFFTAMLQKDNVLLQKGDRVLVDGKHPGVVQYIGLPDDHLIAPELYVGVSLYDNVYSMHNGVYKNKRFFFCPRGHGTMVKISQVKRITPLPKTREVTGNVMFPSYESVKKRRKERERKIKESEEKLLREHEIKRKAQLERFSKSAPPPRIPLRPTRASQLRSGSTDDKPLQPVQDHYDIAYQDYLEREKQREINKPPNPEIVAEIQFMLTKKAFGGDERAERMVETLRKLHRGYNEGKGITLAEGE